MQQVTPNNNNPIQMPEGKEVASIRVVQSCGCGYPKLYVRYKGQTQYVPLKISDVSSSPGLNGRYVDVFSDQAVNGVKSFADHIRVSSSYIKGGATQVFGNTAGGGLFNVLIGTGAGNAMTGQKNIMIGDNACVGARAINNTIAIGVQSGPATNYLGDNNFFLGYKAGYNMTGGSGNVHIGQGSGIPGTYSNRLFIGNPGEPTTLESAHIITGYFDTGVLKFPKGYANTDAGKFLTTGSDGTLVLSAPKMPTDYISNNPVNTLPRDNTQNHGITDANLIQQSLTYWNNSTKTNTPAGFDQGVGITGMSPDGTQAAQIVLDKTSNLLSFRSKATNVWKAWRTVETTDNKVTSLSSPNATTYPTTKAVADRVNAVELLQFKSSNINAGTSGHFCRIMSITFIPNSFNSFAGIYEVSGWHGSNAGEDFAGRLYLFAGGGPTNNNTLKCYFKKNPFSTSCFNFYYTYDAITYTFTIYVEILGSYRQAMISEAVHPNRNAAIFSYYNDDGIFNGAPAGAVMFTVYNIADKDWVTSTLNGFVSTSSAATNALSANFLGDLNTLTGINQFSFNGNAINKPSFFPYGGVIYNHTLNSDTGTQLAIGWNASGANFSDYFAFRSQNAGVFSDWYRVASQQWVTSQIPATPTLQQVTAAGNTSNNNIIRTDGTGGTTVAMDNQGITITGVTSSIAWSRNIKMQDSSSNNLAAMGFFGTDQTLTYGYLTSFPSGSTNPYANADLKFVGGKIGINLPGANIPQQNLDVNGTAAFSSLASSGLRMVTASSNGILGIQSMPVLVETDPVYTADKVNLYRTDAVLNGSVNNYSGDLNNIGNNGIVHIQQSSSTNSPFSQSTGGIVFSTFLNSGAGYKTQMGLEYGTKTRLWLRNQNLVSGVITWNPWKEFLGVGDKISLFTNDAGYISVETDPVYMSDKSSIKMIRGTVASGDDLNNYHGMGIWTCSSVISTTVLNRPVTNNSPFVLSNEGGTSGYSVQKYYDVNSGNIYIRTAPSTGIYGTWKQIIRTGGNISLLNNDAGYITSAAIPAPQTLSLNNFALSISGGNTITLPFTPYLITAQTNLNGISAANTALSISSAATNSPVPGVAGFGFSSWGGATGVQLALMNNNGAYIRTNSSLTSYTAWVKLANLNDIPIVNDATLTLQTSGIATGGTVAFTANSATAKTFTVNVPATNITASLNSTTNVLSINSSTGTDATVDLTPLADGQVLLSGGGWQLKGQGTGKQTVGVNAFDFIIYDSAYTGNIGVTGEASVAFGKGNFVSGDRSASFGSENTSTGSRSFSLGLSSDAVGDGSFAHGQGTTVNGAWAAGFGISRVDGNYAFAAGNGNYAPSYAEVSVGIWGTNYTPASATAVNANDRIFNIGNGTSSAARKDALTVYKSGVVNISNLSGTGNRMVIANASGALSTQAITSGTVTSVGMTVGGAALNVTPAAITSSGTFALTWAGTTSQYINGQGNLVTFPTIPAGTVTSITIGNGLTGSSPITATGTITLGTPSSITLSSTNGVTAGSHTHAFLPGGTTSQYIRGDGSLAAMPSIPTVGNGTLTIQQNGSTVGTFTANQSANTTINLTGGGNEVVDNGYAYGRSNNFGSGWDAAGGFAANSIYITTNTPYQVSENDYTVYLFASGASVILPDPANYRNRMIRLVNATKVEIKAPQQYAITNYDGTSLLNMGVGSYLIQSIRGAGGAWLWYLVGGNS